MDDDNNKPAEQFVPSLRAWHDPHEDVRSSWHVKELEWRLRKVMPPQQADELAALIRTEWRAQEEFLIQVKRSQSVKEPYERFHLHKRAGEDLISELRSQLPANSTESVVLKFCPFCNAVKQKLFR